MFLNILNILKVATIRTKNGPGFERGRALRKAKDLRGNILALQPVFQFLKVDMSKKSKEF